MAIYLSNLRGVLPVVVNTTVLAGRSLIDSFPRDSYRTAKYHLVVEDVIAKRIFNVRFTVTHDSLGAWVTEFDAVPITTDLDVNIEAEYNVTDGVEVYGTFPNDCKISLERMSFVNYEPTLQITGQDGPGNNVYPSDYLYPQG